MSVHVAPPFQRPRRPFAGIHTPIATPFQADGDVDETALRGNVARWMQSPLTGLVVLGSNGEAAQLDDVEADRVVAIVREEVPRDRAFIVGTGRESTRATVQASQRAADAGADAVLVRTPAFFKAQMSADVLERHYREVADISRVPVLLYNVTMFTGVTLAVDSVARLAEHPNIVGMKESGSDIGYIADCVTRTPDDFTMLAGSATTFFHALCAGCDGGVLALGSLFPADLVRMREWVQAGKLEEARELQRRLTPIARSIGGTYGVAGLKAALDLIGLTGGPPRPPLRPSPPAVVDIIRNQLEALGALPLTSSTASPRNRGRD
jgi:4-hydroxy-2-oxoglutarate aldolase